jgi:hypothetical protein
LGTSSRHRQDEVNQYTSNRTTVYTSIFVVVEKTGLAIHPILLKFLIHGLSARRLAADGSQVREQNLTIVKYYSHGFCRFDLRSLDGRRLIPAGAPRPLVVLNAPAAVHAQRTPLSTIALHRQTVFDRSNEPRAVFGIVPPVVQTVVVVLVVRILPVDILAATGAVRVEHGPTFAGFVEATVRTIVASVEPPREDCAPG